MDKTSRKKNHGLDVLSFCQKPQRFSGNIQVKYVFVDGNLEIAYEITNPNKLNFERVTRKELKN